MWAEIKAWAISLATAVSVFLAGFGVYITCKVAFWLFTSKVDPGQAHWSIMLLGPALIIIGIILPIYRYRKAAKASGF